MLLKKWPDAVPPKISTAADLMAAACFRGSSSIAAIRACGGAPTNHWACGKFSEGFTSF